MGTPFITTTELTEKLGQDAVTARGTACITAACDVVRLYTGLSITPGTTTVELDGTGTDTLPLPERPILNAGTVVESGGTLVLDTDYVIGDGVLYRKPGVIDSGWSYPELRTYWWPGRQNVEVTFEHGYTTTPPEIKETALTIAGRLFTRTDPDVVFESQGQRSIRWRDGEGMNGTEKLVLDLYRR
jgi:hypothetical protein